MSSIGRIQARRFSTIGHQTREKEGDNVIAAHFDYHAPRTVPEALKLLGEYGDEAKLLAGGRLRHSSFPHWSCWSLPLRYRR